MHKTKIDIWPTVKSSLILIEFAISGNACDNWSVTAFCNPKGKRKSITGKDAPPIVPTIAAVI